jgi:hypothetical protein
MYYVICCLAERNAIGKEAFFIPDIAEKIDKMPAF